MTLDVRLSFKMRWALGAGVCSLGSVLPRITRDWVRVVSSMGVEDNAESKLLNSLQSLERVKALPFKGAAITNM